MGVLPQEGLLHVVEEFLRRLNAHVVHDGELAVDAHNVAQVRLLIQEHTAVRGPARRDDVRHEQLRLRVHVDGNLLAEVRLPVQDQLIRDVLHHGVAVQGELHVLYNVVVRGAVHLRRGLVSQKHGRVRLYFDFHPVHVPTNVSPTGVRDGVVDLPGIIQVVRADDLERTLVVLPFRYGLGTANADTKLQYTSFLMRRFVGEGRA